MTKDNSLPKNQLMAQLPGRLPGVWRLLGASVLVLPLASIVFATTAADYHKRIRQAVTALDTLAQSDENESPEAFATRDDQTVGGVRSLFPETETIDWNGSTFQTDNSWLHQDLAKYAATRTLQRYELLRGTTERLKSIDERLNEIERPPAGTTDKTEQSRKLGEILQRPEFARKGAATNPLSPLVERFLKWLRSFLPKPPPVSPGSASVLSRAAQIFVIVLALGVLAFVLKLFLPRFLKVRKPRKKAKAKARIVLGERLEPDQSAVDLLSEAEALARRGELRAAIRKGYIALLVELGERKVISLAQHKTNHDYLRAIRSVPRLYGNVKLLTDSFERHWYGLVQANENDWLAFRSAYKQTLR